MDTASPVKEKSVLVVEDSLPTRNEREDMERALDIGVEQYLTKPFTTEQLIEKLRQFGVYD